MAEIERALLPQQQKKGRKVFVLHGMGGIGKTQLAVAFARQHRDRFSTVFWLDGTTESSLKTSIAACVTRISEIQIMAVRGAPDATVSDSTMAVRDFMAWLTLPGNVNWLLVFDNIDQEYPSVRADTDAYSVLEYLPEGDHGSILITTRMADLEQLGKSHQLELLSLAQAEDLFRSRYRKNYGKEDDSKNCSCSRKRELIR